MRELIHDPKGLYASGPDYVHALELRQAERILLVSGTMGLDSTGQAGATLDLQLDLIWSNLRRILESADMSLDNVVRVTSYLRDRDFAKANAAARVAALGARRVPTTALVAQTLESDWLVEIEVIAAA